MSATGRTTASSWAAQQNKSLHEKKCINCSELIWTWPKLTTLVAIKYALTWIYYIFSLYFFFIMTQMIRDKIIESVYRMFESSVWVNETRSFLQFMSFPPLASGYFQTTTIIPWKKTNHLVADVLEHARVLLPLRVGVGGSPLHGRRPQAWLVWTLKAQMLFNEPPTKNERIP